MTSGSGQYLHHLLAQFPQQAPDTRFSLLLPIRSEMNPMDIRQRVVEIENSLAEQGTVEPVPIKLPRLPRQLAKLWWEQVSTPRAALGCGADLLWVPYWAAPLWQPLPVAVTVHDLIPRLTPGYRGGPLQRAYTTLVSYTAKRSAALLTVSQASARDIEAHLQIPSERIHVVHHGPNQSGAAPSSAATEEQIRQKYALPDRYFLYLGGFDRRKNVQTTLRAYRRYLDEGGDPAVALVIAGQLPETDSAFSPDPQKTAAELNLTEQVRFCGWVDEADKPALYAMSEAYLFPSLYEGFGMMVLEAMSAGAPVITSSR